MGPKITVDCSTLMNKGLEVIEAMRLYRLPLAQVSVMVHPQSIVHSAVEFADGAVLALEASGADFIDINMGCPMPKIVNNGDGSALMKDLRHSERCQRGSRPSVFGGKNWFL